MDENGNDGVEDIITGLGGEPVIATVKVELMGDTRCSGTALLIIPEQKERGDQIPATGP
jgi:hypothetical protein